MAVEERPAWLPKKFVDGESLVKSYSQAETKIRDQGTELKSLREQLEVEQLAFVDVVSGLRDDLVAAYARIHELEQADDQVTRIVTAIQNGDNA